MKDTGGDGAEVAGHPPDNLCTLHGPPVIRGNRMYCAWWGGGISVIDCSDLRNMKLVGHLSWAPPFPGSNHTCWPLGDRPYLIVTDEARSKEKFWDAQFMWVIDARDETNPLPVATFMPDREKYYDRPGRFTITCTVTDSQGRKATESRPIEVKTVTGNWFEAEYVQRSKAVEVRHLFLGATWALPPQFNEAIVPLLHVHKFNEGCYPFLPLHHLFNADRALLLIEVVGHRCLIR